MIEEGMRTRRRRQCRRTQASWTSPPMMLLVLFASFIVEPSSPFIIGIHASEGNARTPREHTRSPQATSPYVSISRTSAGQKASPLKLGAGNRGQSDSISKVGNIFGSVLKGIRHRYREKATKKKERDWKDGEYNTTITSKLTYTYADKLLDIASDRRLEPKDAFHVPEDKLMGSAVTRLEEKYDKSRTKARRRLEEMQAEGGNSHGEGTKEKRKRKRDRIATSESIILAKALLLSQKKTLFLTGMLRLLNTSIQAFPALLVARLLRQIESGNALHPSKPLKSAVALVAVLSVKMLVENQYFHRIVKCSCEVRGALAGMIFDKSLRLANGGSGGQTANDEEGGLSEGKKKKMSTKKSTATLGSGGVLNLMATDTGIVESLTLQLHTIWDGLLQITIYTSLLYRYLGPSILWGIAVLFATIPINSITLRLLNRLSKKENEARDARTKRTTECISNMKLLKLQSWERFFAKDIDMHREDELDRHLRRGSVRALNQAISNAVPAITLVATLAAYSKSGRPIVASTIFTAISLFNQLRFPLFFYPMLIDAIANGKNALRRISAYLSQEEVTPYVDYRPKLEGGGGSINMENGNFLWSAPSDPSDEDSKKVVAPALCDAALSIEPGEVVAVIGSVGSGKSALVKGLLGELAPVPRMVVDHSTRGKGMSYGSDVPRVVSYGSIAYCAQEAWLPKGTIRESVVFGREYDKERYLNAIYDAGLDGDITDGSAETAASRGMLTHDTDVGEDGSNLSGGQRARVALARALYEDSAGVFILDDPLSALDASVGSLVFDRVTSRLRQEKAATIFVTNDPNLPRRCDKVILMGPRDGPVGSPQCSNILAMGTYDELVDQGYDLSSIVDTDEDGVSDKENIKEYEIRGDGDGAASKALHARANSNYQDEAFPEEDYVSQIPRPMVENNRQRRNVEVEGKDISSSTSVGTTTDQIEPKAATMISTDDSMSTGAVPISTYVTYFKSVKQPVLVVGALLAYFMSNGAQFFQQFVIAKWTELGTGDAMVSALGAKYLERLVWAAGVVSGFLWLRSYLTMRLGVRASKVLHSKMLSSVFRAPLSFFSATPSGQILTRFGKELEVVDRSLPDGIASVLFCFLQILFSGAALAGIVTPAMIVPLGLVGILYFKTMGRFRPAARDLKRCESKSRAPIYTHFREAVRGVETIRSFPSGSSFWADTHRRLTDENLSVFYSVKALDRWLSIRLETLGNVIVFAAAVASVYLTRMGRLKAGSAGWGLTQALSITGLLTWAVRVLTDLETQFMSVMRIAELTDLDSMQAEGVKESVTAKMPREYSGVGEALQNTFPVNSTAPLAPASDSALQQSGWPWKGHVDFNGVSMRYNPSSPLVVKNVSITVPSGSTLGIVGRTGSGKSSLLLTLFRLVEIEGEGSITIDGVDIRSISMRMLRNSLSIIPQSPVLFAGTVMYNLDATGKASEDDAWEALEAASPELAQQFRDGGTGLNTLISEGGENLSVGQRQLICLARALLEKSKILVLDEATSSVDTITDAQVQQTIRKEFVDKGASVITVAHRLDTVLAYDKIAVLDAGSLVEYGSPDDLLKISNGFLRSLVDADQKNKQKGAKRPAQSFAIS